ncbi:MAG: hypothetical protein K2I99_04280, partial [Bacteroidaceae bacterium]|nr:hypothetical protein [Bacteroidaceae bacterium]
GRVLREPFDELQTANIPRTQRMVKSFPALLLRVFTMSRAPFFVCEWSPLSVFFFRCNQC